MPDKYNDLFNDVDRERRAREAENERLEELNTTDPGAVCKIRGHDIITIEAPFRRFCRWCQKEFEEE